MTIVTLVEGYKILRRIDDFKIYLDLVTVATEAKKEGLGYCTVYGIIDGKDFIELKKRCVNKIHS